MNKKLLLWIFVMVCLVGLANGTSCLSSCTLTGNHYKCTGSFTSCNVFDGVSKSVYIYDATVTYAGSAGGTGADGGSGIINISSNNKVKLENVVFTSTGGAGGAGSAGSALPHGGDGGSAGLRITASSETLIDNISVTLTSGNGGVGDASNTYQSGNGGDGGEAIFVLNSPVYTMNDSDFDINSGTGALGEANSYCPESDDDDARSATGGNGGKINFSVTSSTSMSSKNNLLDADSGAGGNGHASACSRDSGADACGQEGYGGRIYVDFDVGYMDNNNFTIETNVGAGGTARCDCAGDSDADIDGLDGSDSRITIDISNSSSSPNGFIFNSTSGNGGLGDGCSAGGDGDNCYDSNGGDGGFTYLTLKSAYDAVIWNNITLDIAGGTGAGNDWSDDNCPCPQAGDGGGFYYYGYNISIIGGNSWDIDSQAGTNANDAGSGGHGGDVYFYFYGENKWKDLIIDILSGTGGTSNSGACYTGSGFPKCPGRGGDIQFISDNTFTKDNVTITTTAGNGGGGSCTGTSTGFGLGGDTIFSGISLYLNGSSDILFDGGTGTANQGGSAYVTTTTLFDINNADLKMTPGVYTGTNNGTCESQFNGSFSMENSLIQCNASDTATIYGYGMSQVDYRNESIIDLNGDTNIVNWTYSAATPKFLIWNSSFDPTYINWDNTSCKFANRTPASTGSVTFNESCAEIGYDDYSTTINYVRQLWNASGTLKPLPYSYTDYYCKVNVTFPSDTEGVIKANFTWLLNGSSQPYNETNVSLASGNEYTSTAFIGGGNISIGDNWTCIATIYSNSSFNRNGTNLSTVVAAYPYNLKIDVGNDGDYEYTGSGAFNSTNFTIDGDEINQYLKTCDNSTCYVPVVFTSDENSTVIFNELNVSYGVDNPTNTTFNISLAAFSSSSGTLTIGSINFTYPFGDNTTIEIRAHSQDEVSSETYYMSIVQSLFNQSLPSGVSYFEVYPNNITAQDVEPEGQTSSIPIFNITNLHSTENIDILIKLNESWDSQGIPCLELEFTNQSTAGNGTYINTTSQFYCTNITAGGSCGLWGFHDFNCTWGQLSNYWYEPVFVFDSICSDCVRTSDYLD